MGFALFAGSEVCSPLESDKALTDNTCLYDGSMIVPALRCDSPFGWMIGIQSLVEMMAAAVVRDNSIQTIRCFIFTPLLSFIDIGEKKKEI